MTASDVHGDHWLSRRLRTVMEIDPGCDALEYEGRWASWGDLHASGAAVQSVLAAHDAPDGARIGIVLRNHPGAVATLLSAFGAGQSVVAISHLQQAAGIAEDMAGLDLFALVGSEADWGAAELVQSARRHGVLGIAVGAVGDPVKVAAEPSGGGSDRRPASPGVAITMLTSGTTGRPKRVPVSYRNLEASLTGSEHYDGSGSEGVRLRSGVAILVAPILHTSGLFRLLLNFTQGRRVAMLPRFEVAGLLRLIDAYDAKVLALTPTALRMILDAGVAGEAFTGVRSIVCGTAPVAAELIDEFEAAFGVPVLVAYGATEFAGGIAGWTLEDHRLHRGDRRGSVGRVHPGTEVAIVDPKTGTAVPPGQTGRVMVRTVQAVEGALASDDGWVATNDLGRVDADRFLWISGRLDDAIIRGGFKVSAAAVGEVLARHPHVRDAAVVGVADRRLGQVPVAAVEVAAGERFDGELLGAWARERLPPYQVPVRFFEVAALPRTPSLKVDQQGLLRLVEALMAGEPVTR